MRGEMNRQQAKNAFPGQELPNSVYEAKLCERSKHNFTTFRNLITATSLDGKKIIEILSLVSYEIFTSLYTKHSQKGYYPYIVLNESNRTELPIFTREKLKKLSILFR